MIDDVERIQILSYFGLREYIPFSKHSPSSCTLGLSNILDNYIRYGP